jgi:hypothetical protein
VVDGIDGLWALAIATSLLEAASTARPVDLAGFATRLPQP